MLDILSIFLTDNATPELKAAIESAHQVFERIELPNYEDEFVDLLMVDDTADAGSTLISVTTLTKNLLVRILAEHGITVVDEVAIETMASMVNGLLDLADYEDRATLYQTATLEGPLEETLAEMLALVTSLTVEELLLDIEVVDMMLIKRIKEIASTPFDKDEMQTEETNKKHVEAFIRFYNGLHQPRLKIAEYLLKNSGSVGYEFGTYIEMIGPELESLSNEQIADELIGMALISRDGLTNPRGVIQQHIEHYITNVDTVTRVTILVGQILLRLEL